MNLKLSEMLVHEDLTLEARLYEVEAACTDEYREVHKQAVAEWISQLEDENEALRKLFNDAADRIKRGTTKRMMFKCSHCQKDTPLLIDALLAGDKDA